MTLLLVVGFYLPKAYSLDVTSPLLVGDVAEENGQPGGYLARIESNSPEDVEKALRRAEVLFENGHVPAGTPPVAFILHGPEVAIFFRENYNQYKPIVDLAARLSAFQVIDIKVCETRMGVLGRQRSVLYPFVSTVPFGPREVERLLDKKYVYF